MRGQVGSCGVSSTEHSTILRRSNSIFNLWVQVLTKLQIILTSDAPPHLPKAEVSAAHIRLRIAFEDDDGCGRRPVGVQHAPGTTTASSLG
jgi:hypothetical protein